MNRLLKKTLKKIIESRYTIPLVIGTTVAFSIILFGNYAADDAYIVATFARNLATGKGFVFNIGEPSSGATPLYTCLLAFCFWATCITPLWLNILGSLFLAATLYVTYKYMLLEKEKWFAFAVVILLSTFALTLFYGQFGMDTMFYLFTVVLTVYTFAKWQGSADFKKYLPYFCAGLSFLVRFESVLLFLALLVAEKQNTKTQKLVVLSKCTTCFIITILPWFVWHNLTFDTILPSAYIGKGAGSLGATEITINGFSIYLEPTTRNLEGAFKFSPFLAIVAVATICFVLLKKISSNTILHKPHGKALCIYAILILIFYSLSPLYSFRYVFPVFIPVLIFGLEGITMGIRKLKATKRKIYKLCSLGVVGVLVLTQTIWLVDTYNEVRYWKARVDVYREAAHWLNANLPLNSSVAAFELGYISYFGNRTVVDYAGIIYPYDGEPTAYLKSKKPTHIFLVGNDIRIEQHPLWNITASAKVVWDKKLPSEWSHRGVNHVYIIECNW